MVGESADELIFQLDAYPCESPDRPTRDGTDDYAECCGNRRGRTVVPPDWQAVEATSHPTRRNVRAHRARRELARAAAGIWTVGVGAGKINVRVR